jgi:FAD/FMN-containing dehydrogenase
MLIGGRLIDGQGRSVDLDVESQPEVLRAARCSLGLLGIFTSIRLRLVPAYELERRELWARTDAVLANLSALVDHNRNFDFYWYPRSDGTKLRVMNERAGAGYVLDDAKLAESKRGWSHEVLSKTRTLKFDEIEYALPREAGPECFQALRQRIKTKHRQEVAWRVLYRTVAKDDAYLSPAHDRDTTTISVHHNAGLPYEALFADVESIFRAHDGRPHWGKKHNATAAHVAAAYPDRDRFLAIRERFDPAGVFANVHLDELLGSRH